MRTEKASTWPLLAAFCVDVSTATQSRGVGGSRTDSKRT